MSVIVRRCLALILGAMTTVCAAADATVAARPRNQPTKSQHEYTEQLVTDSRIVLQSMAMLEESANLRADIVECKAVLIFPQAVRAGFVLGGAGGNGLLLVRDAVSGRWTGPAFFTLASASLGLQAGISSAQMVIVVRNQKALDSLYDGKVTVGADAVAAFGSKGNERGANWNADLVVYARAKGAFMGATVDGSVLEVRSGLNHAYYGREVTPIQILVEAIVSNEQAAPLLDTLFNFPR